MKRSHLCHLYASHYPNERISPCTRQAVIVTPVDDMDPGKDCSGGEAEGNDFEGVVFKAIVIKTPNHIHHITAVVVEVKNVVVLIAIAIASIMARIMVENFKSSTTIVEEDKRVVPTMVMHILIKHTVVAAVFMSDFVPKLVDFWLPLDLKS